MGTGSRGRLGPGSAALGPLFPAPAGVLLDREHWAGLSRLTDNLQPGMSTTIRSLISTDLQKDALLFTRLIVACPRPRAGASSAGGAGDVLGGKRWPHVSCTVFLHRKNTFTSDFSCTLTQPQGHTCPYRYCTTFSPKTSSFESLWSGWEWVWVLQ